MSEDSPRKWPVALLPAILTTSAALIAASTTVFVNMRNDQRARDLAEREAARAQAAIPRAAVEAPAARLVALRLDRIVVEDDGAAMGTADWRFTIEADGLPLFVYAQDGLSDRPGRNVVVPAERTGASLLLPPTQPVQLTVKAWRSGWMRGSQAPRATGTARVSQSAGPGPVAVAPAEGKGGRFTFHLSVQPAGGD